MFLIFFIATVAAQQEVYLLSSQFEQLLSAIGSGPSDIEVNTLNVLGEQAEFRFNSLNYNVTAPDVVTWFQPLNCTVTSIQYGDDGVVKTILISTSSSYVSSYTAHTIPCQNATELLGLAFLDAPHERFANYEAWMRLHESLLRVVNELILSTGRKFAFTRGPTVEVGIYTFHQIAGAIGQNPILVETIDSAIESMLYFPFSNTPWEKACYNMDEVVTTGEEMWTTPTGPCPDTVDVDCKPLFTDACKNTMLIDQTAGPITSFRAPPCVEGDPEGILKLRYLNKTVSFFGITVDAAICVRNYVIVPFVPKWDERFESYTPEGSFVIEQGAMKYIECQDEIPFELIMAIHHSSDWEGNYYRTGPAMTNMPFYVPSPTNQQLPIDLFIELYQSVQEEYDQPYLVSLRENQFVVSPENVVQPHYGTIAMDAVAFYVDAFTIEARDLMLPYPAYVGFADSSRRIGPYDMINGTTPPLIVQGEMPTASLGKTTAEVQTNVKQIIGKVSRSVSKIKKLLGYANKALEFAANARVFSIPILKKGYPIQTGEYDGWFGMNTN